MMNRTILFCILTLCSILSTYAQDKKEKQRFAPPPTNRNFSIVGAFSWMSMAEISPAAYNMDLSAHYIKPSFALDVYYEKGLQDMFRGRILGEGTFPAIEIFTQRIELNLAITYRSKIGRKGSLFNRGSVYRGGTQYDLYSRGEGNAAVYKQIRFGGSDKIFTYLSTAFSSSPEINSRHLAASTRWSRSSGGHVRTNL